MTLDEHTALIPIDVQQAFDHAPWPPRNNPGMEANGLRLLEAWRASGRPLIHVKHDSVVPGSTLAAGHPGNAQRPGFEPQGAEPLVRKSVNAAFIGTDLDLRLRRLGVTSVVLFGISTDMCVSTTARVAANLGYRTIVVGDASFCFDQADADGAVIPAELVHRVHLATLRAEFAEVVDTDGLLRSLG
ncbi:cysteine hydrolase family protein [Agrilutibacter solisilvae]|uniref:Cysteine hydrolase n=1 Tax=Agrilutibacter solisilvae TaxID=2763317 RepID=A0A974Y1J4_9GAMM|nr:cysteine hydrolase family protein [Lysobacter solisilvae]QSX78843.1 cysteine hydrolase [Lysobacter solisilvae]